MRGSRVKALKQQIRDEGSIFYRRYPVLKREYLAKKRAVGQPKLKQTDRQQRIQKQKDEIESIVKKEKESIRVPSTKK